MVIFMVRGKDIRHVGKLDRKSVKPFPAELPSKRALGAARKV
jgi:hypothetical protein